MSNKVRLGLVGTGGMGVLHAEYLREGKIDRCELVAACDVNESRLAAFKDLKTYTDSAEMIRSGEIDAILIATPHFFHTTVGIDALEQGLHVLVEKPISVHVADCQRLLAAHKNKKQVFAAVLHYRTTPRFIAIKELIDSGELGELARINWIITDWFRTEAYYASGGWRGTWKGEGGGVLMNQCPHQLDLLQWICGMPSEIRAFCRFGKWHDIEVEDDVTAYLSYPNGATCVFVTTTGETPGTNRLEIAGERGKLVLEHGTMRLIRNEVPMSVWSRDLSNAGFSLPATSETEIPFDPCGGKHELIAQNFVDAILDGVPLIAPAEEGVHSVEIANAMLYSTLTDATVRLPLDGAAYEAALNKLIAESRFEKKNIQETIVDVRSSLR